MINRENAPIGIIGAMDVEIEQIVENMTDINETVTAGLVFRIGKLKGVPLVAVKCGAGKVNAAVCAQLLIMNYSPRLVLNIGVAGGIGPDVHIGDLVIADSCVQHDFDVSAVGEPAGQITICGAPITELPCDRETAARLRAYAEEIYGSVHTGIIATGDVFVADAESCLDINRRFGAIACEMEGAAVAHVCFMNAVPAAVLRSISDNANDSAAVDFLEFVAEAAKKSQRLIEMAAEGLVEVEG